MQTLPFNVFCLLPIVYGFKLLKKKSFAYKQHKIFIFNLSRISLPAVQPQLLLKACFIIFVSSWNRLSPDLSILAFKRLLPDPSWLLTPAQNFPSAFFSPITRKPQPGSSSVEQMVYKNLGHAHMIENRTPISNISCNNYVNSWSERWPRNCPVFPLLQPQKSISSPFLDVWPCAVRDDVLYVHEQISTAFCMDPGPRGGQYPTVMHVLRYVPKVKTRSIKKIKLTLWCPFVYCMNDTKFSQTFFTDKLLHFTRCKFTVPVACLWLGSRVCCCCSESTNLTDKYWTVTAPFKDNKAAHSCDL